MSYLPFDLGRIAFAEGRITPSELDCLEFAKASENVLMARSDFYMGIAYAKAGQVFADTGKQISALQGAEMVGVQW